MTGEEKLAAKLDEALKAGEINEAQHNDLENVLIVLADKKGGVDRKARVAFQSAFRAAKNNY
jgi:hypothetical protein